MFHNYFFLKRYARALKKELEGLVLLECFSQHKNELIAGLGNETREKWLRVNLDPQIALIQVMDDFKRAKKNSVNLFDELLDQKVDDVAIYKNERSFYIQFDTGLKLIFKMHTSRSNLLIEKHDRVISVFRTQIPGDKGITPSGLHQDLNLDFERFAQLEGELQSFLPALGKEIKNHLKNQGYENKSIKDRWDLLQDVLQQVENNPVFIYKEDEKPVLTLIRRGNYLLKTDDILLAANTYYKEYTHYQYLKNEKSRALKNLENQIKKTRNYLEKTSKKLQDVEQSRSYEEIANILMANLHNIQTGVKSVTLDDFYTNQPIQIKLNPQLSPQKNAENLYRKSKNHKIEIEKLRENISTRQKQLATLLEEQDKIKQIEDFKALRKETPTQAQSEKKSLPFHQVEKSGFKILIGKNAKSNDHLTLKEATKNDYWLHAKDVAGSHVVIKHQAGKPLPNDVLERAAELAAWFSKRKNETLCPVIFTQKKFVRKVKGAPAGQVIVEREEVVMVPPKGI